MFEINMGPHRFSLVQLLVARAIAALLLERTCSLRIPLGSLVRTGSGVPGWERLTRQGGLKFCSS